MTRAEDDWRPSPSLPRLATEAEQARVVAALPRRRFARNPKTLRVQRLEAVTIERGQDAAPLVFHPEYEELATAAKEVAWARLHPAGPRALHRGAQAVPPRLKSVMGEARARLDELRVEDPEATFDTVMRGEDVAVVRVGAMHLAFGLESARVLGDGDWERPRRRSQRTGRPPPGRLPLGRRPVWRSSLRARRGRGRADA